MELRNALGLITQTIFADKFGIIHALRQYEYENTSFRIPLIICNDGWSVSIQIYYGAYCASENGWQKLGYEWKSVQWGGPSEEEPLLKEHSEFAGDVGVINVDKMQAILDKHEGIDWDATLNLKKQKQ